MENTNKSYNKKHVEYVDGILKESCKDYTKYNNENRIAVVKNIDLYKKVKGVYLGKGLLPQEYLANDDTFYPKMPWEQSIKKINITDHDISNLQLMNFLANIHSSIAFNGLSVWIDEKEVENEDSHFLSEVKPVLNSILETFQMFYSQNILELEKYMHNIMMGMDISEANRQNKALLNVLSYDQITEYMHSKHHEIHMAIKDMKNIEIDSGYERERKITVYKNLSTVVRETLIYGKFLRETRLLWEHQKYFYGIQ